MKLSKLFCVATLAFAPHFCLAQQLSLNAPPAEPEVAPTTAAAAIVKPVTPAPMPTWESKADRWLDVNALDYGTRYRSVFGSKDTRSFDQGQQKFIADGKLKFDREGRFGLDFHVSSGRYFNWSYADFIGGGQQQFIDNSEVRMTPLQLYVFTQISPPPAEFFNSGGGQLYFRQLYLTAKPLHAVEFQFGGLSIEKGVNTEATSYDDDGYMSGERAIVRDSKHVWLSKVEYTRGYLGDLYTPNFFARGQRLAVTNYWQIMGQKDFAKRMAVSTDYSMVQPSGETNAIKTTREAITADVHEAKVLDQIRLEAYQRINQVDIAGDPSPVPTGKGFAFTASRRLGRRASVDMGVASIDGGYYCYLGSIPQAAVLGLSVNGDQYGIGRRYFVRPTVSLTSSISLIGYYNQVFDYTPDASVYLWNQRALTAGVVFDLKKGLFSETKGK